ncbi:hypothetical protein GWK47_014242 [Chionoecetes opilio]|uniref:Uncharacterized protein n=1 Tax=Chionoecetes opilio TaxID=41210 RepID=A0A8J5CL46_CHIOP|nr:hypothetical protein GWK47_014242 [Chionoecetes opilio]
MASGPVTLQRLFGVRVCDAFPLPTCGAALVVVVPAFPGWPLQLQHGFTGQPPKCGFWGSPNRPLGETASKNGQVLRRFFHFVRVHGSRLKERLPSSPRRWRWCLGKARIPTQKKSRCVERILRCTHHGRTWIGPRSGALKLTSRIAGVFSLALMTLFDIGHADAFDLITVDEDRSSCWASAARMDPVASCKESTNPWPTESDGVWSAAC